MDHRPASVPNTDTDDGGEGAFEEFYKREHPLQVRRAFLLVRSNELANDIVHEAMVKVWQRWDDLENAGGYLNQAVLNGCQDAFRRASTRHVVTRRLRAVGGDQAEAEVLDDVLASLPFNQRASVVLRFYCGWSTIEIAQAFNCPPNSVGPWISRGLASLKKELS